MTKEEAIDILNDERIVIWTEPDEEEIARKQNEAIDMAIEALSADTTQIVYCKDCINRWDIIRCPIDDTYTVNDNDYCSFGIKKIKLDIDYDAIRI